MISTFKIKDEFGSRIDEFKISLSYYVYIQLNFSIVRVENNPLTYPKSMVDLKFQITRYGPQPQHL